MLIDSHCHIYDEELESFGGADAIVKSMAADGLDALVCVGCDMESSRACVELSNAYENVYATVGIHPYDADTATPENLEILRGLATSNKKVVAFGEFGLDFHREGSNRPLQIRAMEMQYDLARELGLPQIYHLRDGYGEFCEFAKVRDFPDGGVIHCFSSSKEIAKVCVKKGFYISFSGTLTYKNAVNLVRAAEYVPLDRLLVETDSPYLTPDPERGHINFPKNVRFVAKKLAEIKGVPLEEIERITAENTRKVFGIGR